MTVCCEVALPVPLDRVFTYAVGDGQRPQRGARVVAPFRNEKLIGVVTAVGVATPPDFEVRFLEGVLDDEPLLSEQLLALAEWIAQYYLAPLGEVLRGMLPLMAEVRRSVYYRITDLGRDVLANAVETGVEGNGGAGSVLSHPFHKEREKDGAPSGSLYVRGSGLRAKRGKRLSGEEHDLDRRVLTRLASGEPVKVSTLRTATSATLPVLASLVRRKWIARESRAAERDARRTERFAVLETQAALHKDSVLTKKQQAILDELGACGGEMALTELRRRDLP